MFCLFKDVNIQCLILLYIPLPWTLSLSFAPLAAEYNPENSLFLIAILKLQQKLLNKV